jgi:hypothetical protein
VTWTPRATSVAGLIFRISNNIAFYSCDRVFNSLSLVETRLQNKIIEIRKREQGYVHDARN